MSSGFRRRPAPRCAAPARYTGRRQALRHPRRRACGGRTLSLADLAQLGLVGFGIGRGGRLTLAVLVESFGAACRVGWALRARLLEIGRIVDHRSHVVLVGAAEIVIGLVL